MEEENIDVETESFSEAEKDGESEVQNVLSEASESLDESESTHNITKETNSETITKPVKFLQLPISKVKQIMKMDPEVILVQQDAVFLVAKATEMFIEYITKETNKQLAGQKRKTVMKRDVDATIESISQLCFLDGALE